MATAKQLGLPWAAIDIRDYYAKLGRPLKDRDVRARFDAEAMALVEPFHADMILLAGYVWATTDVVLDNYLVVNVHPADLAVTDGNGRRLLAGANDIEGVKHDTDPRTVNRHSFTEAEIQAAVEKPVVQKLLDLLRFRNSCPAFDGAIEIGQDSSDGTLRITWTNGDCAATLDADFKTKNFCITERQGGTVTERFRQEA